MSVAFQIDIRDSASPAVDGLGKALTPQRIKPVIGVAARNVVRTHLRDRDRNGANAMGGPRTHFFLSAAQGTSWAESSDGVVVSIASIGMRQRYFGGVIRPKKAKFLTLPALPEAYGKRASEFPGLRFSIEFDPKLNTYRAALVQGAHTTIKRRTVKGVARTFAGSEVHRRVIFWLVKQVNQKADASVLPTTFDLSAGIKSSVNAYLDRALERAKEGSEAN